MKAYQKILIVAAIATAMVVTGTVAYLNLSPIPRLYVSTTTSLYDTGLLDQIKKQYEATRKVSIYFNPQGTGIALADAAAGNADVVLVHAPSSEYPYLANDTLICRKIIAWNYFTIVGPSFDPAKISGKNTTEALQDILTYGRDMGTMIWTSRNDSSGTHSKEIGLWKSAGYNYTMVSKEDSWFKCTNQGMGATLLVADQKNAYTLSDLGTYLQFSQNNAISLSALIQGPDYSLLNVYSVYAVNPQKVSNVSYNEAIAFMKWLISDAGQQVINAYGTANYSQPLFHGAVQPLKDNDPQPDVSWIQKYAFFNGTECPTQYQDDHPELYP